VGSLAVLGLVSLGMRQRLGLGVALLGDPRVLVLDEPVNGLDPEGIRWLRGLLRALASDGRTVLLSSHLMAELAITADRLVVIARGRLLADATVSELSRHHESLEDAYLQLVAGGARGGSHA
jgi:ABC-2 type transport system ATP-binding protein